MNHEPTCVQAMNAAGEFVDAIDGYRAARGVAPLEVDQELSDVAAWWSPQMAAAGDISHDPDLEQLVHGWRALGENVGSGPDVASIESAFEASPHHAENMAAPYFDRVGVAVVASGDLLYVTEDFKGALQTPAPSSKRSPRMAPAPTARTSTSYATTSTASPSTSTTLVGGCATER